MLTNNISETIKVLLRRKVTTVLKIVGLSVGIIAFLLIMLHVDDELTYDHFHKNSSRIARLTLERETGEGRSYYASNYGALAQTLSKDLASVETCTRLHFVDRSVLFETGNQLFKSEKILFTDTSFFKIFSFQLVKGLPSQVFRQSYSVIISEKFAKKYFGSKDPINSIVRMKTDKNVVREYTITGICKDVPNNSHFNFDILTNGNNKRDLDWDEFADYVYVLLKTPGSMPRLQQDIRNYLKRYKDDTNKEQLSAQWLTDIHLKSDLLEEIERNGNIQTVYSLEVVAFLIVIIVWINYVNLSVARALERSKEIAVRKINGATRKELLGQLLMESILINLISIVVATTLTGAFTPTYSEFIGKAVSLSQLSLKTTFLAVGVLSIGTFLSALYPALIISDFKPVIFFQSGSMNVVQGERFRNWLLIFQFFVSTAVMILTVVIYSQISFLEHRDKGININSVVVIKAPAIVDSTWQTIDPIYLAAVENFRNQIIQFSHIKDMTAISHCPGEEVTWGANGYRKQGDERNHYLKMMGIDYQFLDLFQIKVVAGRNFQRQNTADRYSSILLNKAAVRELGFKSVDEAINQPLDFFYDGKKEQVGTIVGVIDDYLQETAHRGTSPTFYRLLPRALLCFAIKVDGNEKLASMDKIKSAYSSMFPTFAFNYDYLDDLLIHDLKDDVQFYLMFVLFSIVSVTLCCFGLFGIASLSIARKMKEISIRKLLGSTISQTVMLLIKRFLLMAMASTTLAIIISYFLLDHWLLGFAYHIKLHFLYFLLPSTVMLVLILIIVGYHSLKASTINPLKNLRANN